MNDPEFNTWLDGYLAVFPDFRSWFSQIDPTAKKEMVETWRNAFIDVELRDAKAVTARIVGGDDPATPAYERELTVAHVRRLAKENHRRRSEGSRKREEAIARRSSPRGPSAGELYGKMLKLMDDHPEMTAREAAEEIFPEFDDVDDGRRFDCFVCLDSGIVIVWSGISVRAAITGHLDEATNRRVMGAPCTCSRGQKKIWTGDSPPRGWVGWMSTEVTYTDQRYCVCPKADTDRVDNIEALKDWAALRQLEWQKSKRHSEFDDFNSHGAAP